MVTGTALSAAPGGWVPVHAIVGGLSAYNGLTAVLLNLAVSAALSAILPNRARDETRLEQDERTLTPARA